MLDPVSVVRTKPETVPRRVATVAVLSLFAVSVLSLYAGFNLLTETATELPGQSVYSRYSATFFPQGWAFFTRSPRTPEIVSYRYEQGQLTPLTLGPNAQPRWILGLDRTPRTQEFEYELLNASTLDIEWSRCGGRVSAECVDAVLAGQTSLPIIDNPFQTATVCGETVALAKVATFPWAFANAGFADSEAIDEVKTVSISCSAIDE